MTYFPVQPRYSVYVDSLGDPLDDGYIYLGKANLDPTVYPAKASWDEAGLYPITFPVRTMNGYPLRDGIPAQMYLNFADNTEYSVLINDEDGVEVYSSTTGLIGYFPSGDGGDAATLNGLASSTAATADTIAARDSSGDIAANTFESTVATGTAPLTVASTTVVSNLNAHFLDGQQGSYYAADSGVVHTTGAEEIAGGKTITTAIILNNDIALRGKDTGGTGRNIIYVSATDVCTFGNASLATNLISNGTLTYNGASLATGTIDTTASQTITVVDGLITSIV